MSDFEARLTYSLTEISKREAIKVKKTDSAINISDEINEAGSLIIEGVQNLHEVSVHNERAENKDYNVYILQTASGDMYKTSSYPCFSAAKDILEELKEEIEAGEIVSLKCYKAVSKNSKTGGMYITCTLV